MPALRHRGMDLEPTAEAYARLSLAERLEYVDGAVADYQEVVRQTPKRCRTQVQLALLPFFVGLRRQRNRLRQQIARKAQD